MTATSSTTLFRTAVTLCFLFSLFLLLAVPAGTAHAQLIPDCDPVPDDTPRSAGVSIGGITVGGGASGTVGKKDCGVEHILQLLVNIYNLLLGFAAFIAILFIILGGTRMFIWSIIEQPQEELTAAKRTILRAIAGLVIVLIAYVIVNTLIVVLGGGSLDEILQPLRTT